MDDKIRRSLIDIYDRYAEDRDKYNLHVWKLQEQERFLSLLREEKKENLLEIGAGPGHTSRFFRDNGIKVVCTDISCEMIRLCREKELSVCVMDFYDISFQEGSFDAVWALNCLLHVPKKELQEVLKRIRDVLRPGGLFYMGVYGGSEFEGIWPDDFYTPKRFFSLYTDEHIRKVVEDIFEVVCFDPIDPEQGHFQCITLRKNEEK